MLSQASSHKAYSQTAKRRMRGCFKKSRRITEHKHYLQAAGMTFALYTQRTGTGVTTDGTAAQAASTSYSCPAGQTVSGTSCIVPILVPPAQNAYSCTNGAAPVGSTCPVQNITTAAPSQGTSCPLPASTSGLWVQSVYNTASQCNFTTLVSMTWTDPESGTTGTYWGLDAAKATAQNGLGYSCNWSGDEYTGYYIYCTRTLVVTYTCPATYTASGTGAATVCSKSITSLIAATPVFACQAGQTATGSGASLACQTSVSTAALASYSCPAGYGPQGNQCVASSKLSTAAQQTRYFQQDHLGSTVVITDEAGVVVERLSYDAWGKRRNANGLPDPADSLVGLTTDRGYTEHEHLDEVGVIHMNGRVYDPLVGRFMSADPFIQAPFELQSHNRYAYVMNNPLAFTDPSGYFLDGLIGGVSDTLTNILQPLEGAAKPIAAIAIAYYTGQWVGAGTFWGAVAGGAAGGFAGAALNGANLEQALKSGFTGGASAALFFGAGEVGEINGKYGVAHYAAHAGAGCISSVAQGGRCGSGIASAVMGLAGTEFSDGKSWNDLTKGVVATATGGLASVVAGGTFANGARTAAYGYLFNKLEHEISRHAALGEARRAAGIPSSAIPEVTYEKLYDGNGTGEKNKIRDANGKQVEGRVYRYEVNGKTISIQEHSIGHMQRNADGKWALQEKGHFNVRGSDNLNVKPHYYFNSRINDVIRYWTGRGGVLVPRGTQD